MIPVFHGEIKDGRISLYQREMFATLIGSLEGKRVELVLRKHKAKRSNGQNGLYWSVYVPVFAKYCGYTDDEMHEAFKLMFLKRHGGKFETVGSTAELSTAEFTEFLGKIDLLAADNGLFIPRAGQVDG